MNIHSFPTNQLNQIIDITGLIASSEVPQLAAHDECVLSLDVNKENPQEVLTSSTDGTIKLWNITGTDDGTSPFSLLQTYTGI